MAKRGLFDHETLTVKFGGKLSKPHNVFTATAVKVPTYTYSKKERECLGGGWYGGIVKNEYTIDNLYLIFRENECIGMMQPYPQGSNIKSDLLKLNNQAQEYLNKNPRIKPGI